MAMPVALRLAWRELRGGLSGFRVFIACLALGVAAIAGVNSMSRALTTGVVVEGRTILGGDLSMALATRRATPVELAALSELGRVSELATLRAMVRLPDESRSVLAEVKAIGPDYPQGGRLVVETADGGRHDDGEVLLPSNGGLPGALAAPELFDRLGVRPGARVSLGDAEMELRGILRNEPDRLSSGLGFGPRLIVTLDALTAAGLDRPGSLITWTYRLALPPDAAGRPADDAALAAAKAAVEAKLPEAGWSIRTRLDASPALRRNIEQFSQFLTLVGLTALVVGGVGVANAVASFVDLKRPAIAALKCLGASSRLVFAVYLTQAGALAAIGVAIGLGIGAALPFLARPLLEGLVPVSAIRVYPLVLATAALFGALVTLAFALGPLGRAGTTPAASLFADRAIGERRAAPPAIRAAQLGALVLLAGLAVLLSNDRRLAGLYVVAVAAAFVVLRLVASLIMAAASRARVPARGRIGTALRLAVRAIHRPGALTPSVVLSLGLGLTLLVALALVDTNLRGQLSGAVTARAPDFFFVGLQESERPRFEALVQRLAPGGALETVPMLRGRIAAVKGVRAADLRPAPNAVWALRGDRGVTYADTLPANSTLTKGEWWPAGHEGEPLVSLESGIAEGLGVTVGDAITVNVLGREVTAQVASLREVDWDSLGINFVLVFSPNTFRGAPHSVLATLKRADGGPAAASDGAIVAEVTRAFPAATSVSVRDTIESINRTIGQLALAVRVAASLALAISILVLGGALAAGHRQRRQDAVILKTLGATRPVLLGAFLAEYGLLGMATATFALGAGSAAAWYVLTRIMELQFAFPPAVALTTLLVALAVTIGVGLAGTLRILAAKPAVFLKSL